MSQEQLPYEDPEDKLVDREQPLMEHLLELRNRTVRAFAALAIVFVVLSPFMKQIFDVLSQPLMVALPDGAKMLATGVVAFHDYSLLTDSCLLSSMFIASRGT